MTHIASIKRDGATFFAFVRQRTCFVRLYSMMIQNVLTKRLGEAGKPPRLQKPEPLKADQAGSSRLKPRAHRRAVLSSVNRTDPRPTAATRAKPRHDFSRSDFNPLKPDKGC
jgi:hypothetical protein